MVEQQVYVVGVIAEELELAQVLLRFAQPFIGKLALGYVLQCTAQGDYFALVVADGFAFGIDPERVTVGMHDGEFQVVAFAGARGLVRCRVDLLPGFERQHGAAQRRKRRQFPAEDFGHRRRTGNLARREVPVPGAEPGQAVRFEQFRFLGLERRRALLEQTGDPADGGGDVGSLLDVYARYRHRPVAAEGDGGPRQGAHRVGDPFGHVPGQHQPDAEEHQQNDDQCHQRMHRRKRRRVARQADQLGMAEA